MDTRTPVPIKNSNMKTTCCLPCIYIGFKQKLSFFFLVAMGFRIFCNIVSIQIWNMQSQKRPFTKLQIQQSIFYNINNDSIKKS